MNPSPEGELPTSPEPNRWGSRMFLVGAAILVGLEVYFGLKANVREPVHLQLGLGIVFLAFLPALLWARRGQRSLPVFETLLFTSANTYAFPLLNGHRDLANYSDGDITTAALGIVIFQIVAIAAYEITRGQPSLHRFWRDEVISRDIGPWLTYGLALNTAYVLVSTFTTLIPDAIGSVLRAVFFGIGIICTFITSRRLGLGELSASERTFFFVNIALQCLGMISTLFLVGAVSLLLLALIGYVSSSGRVPIVICAVSLLSLAVLHNGKAPMRAKYWEEGQTTPAITQLPAFFSEWIGHGLTFDDPEEEGKITSKLIDRTSLFHIMCLVVSVTPGQQPFLNGETYGDIPAQFVPRLFWPDKPPAHVSTSKLSVYYGLQTEEDTQKTTIGFGMVTEAYANFGFFGLGLVAAFLGAAIKKVQCLAAGGPIFSYGGLLLVIMLAWSFQVEFTLSMWLSSLYQACVAVLGLPFLLRTFLGK